MRKTLVAALAALTMGLSSGTEASSAPGHDSVPITPATITYDAAGIPTVQADDEASGYAGLCYAMAKDRLFQMDLFRRSAYGRLAEILGPGPGDALIQQDALVRVQDLATHATNRLNAAATQVRVNLSACSIGVNKYIDEATSTQSLPLEFAILQYAPEYWSPADSVAILIFLGTGFSNIGTQVKLHRAALGATFGAGIASDLIPDIPEDPSMFDAAGT